MTTTAQDLHQAGIRTQQARDQATDLLTRAARRKDTAYQDYLQAHRTRRALGESRQALADPAQDTSAPDQEFQESQQAFRQLIREIYATRLLRPADLIQAAGITRQRLHQILKSVN